MNKRNVLSLVTSIAVMILMNIPLVAFAASNGAITYTPLAPIPGIFNASITLGRGDSLAGYIDSWVKILVMLSTGLAVIYVVWGGVEYAMTDSFSTKANAKSTIMRALGGLILALVSYLILNTINPDLLTGKIQNLQDLSVAPVGGGDQGSQSAVTPVTSSGGTPDAEAERELANQLNQNGAVGPAAGGFPNADWNAYALQQVEQSGLMDLSPSDAAKYFPNGQPTAQGWVDLLSGIAKAESGYNPKDVTYEPTMGYNSVGLLSLSAADSVAKKLGYSEQDLLDPYKNIQAGVQILTNQVQKDGVITAPNASGKGWIGASAYWSTLRPK